MCQLSILVITKKLGGVEKFMGAYGDLNRIFFY
jgi:hypothetical protein